ncbi:MAG: DUF5618 family protein [Bacteroidales bacterium]|nr:DUF5618 family protein [Bacteroidales bacterium]MDD4216352.1 DUF5618 family protein [Bacteroidales bacterium]MDY0140490.1 DUF5618 family protein [Bacteroidales bacterium]
MAVLKKENLEHSEALRYIANAKTILKEKAGKNGNFYTDGKYVSMACNTAWGGVLIVLNGKMKRENVKLPAKNRMNVDIYREYLSKKNKTILKCFNSAYNHLHLFGGYDKELSVANTKAGLDFAQQIIDWCK